MHHTRGRCTNLTDRPARCEPEGFGIDTQYTTEIDRGSDCECGVNREQQRLDRIAKEGSDRYAPKEAEVSKRPPEEE